MVLSIALLCASYNTASAQHNLSEGTFTTNGVPGSNIDNNGYPQNDTTYTGGDEGPTFTIGDYFHGLAIQDSLKVQHVFFGSLLMPGTAQYYNRQKWKIPVIYGLMGGCIGGAIASKEKRAPFVIGAVATYFASVLDGVVCYKSDVTPLPARHTIYSALIPGWGQAANGDYWKIPIFYAGFAATAYFWATNQQQYNRYKNYLLHPEEYHGSLSQKDLIWYRDKHRRYRDYSILGTALVYILNIIDANVFAHMSSFDISDDMGVTMTPGVIDNSMQSTEVSIQGEGGAPATTINVSGPSVAPVEPAIGFTLGITF